MYFRGYSHFTMNERLDGKTDFSFELRTVENRRRSIKGKMALFICTVLFTCTVCLHYCSRHCSPRWIDDVALTDDVAWSCWTKIVMYCWWWRGTILVDQKMRVQFMQHVGLFSTKPRYCSNRMVKPCYCSNRVVKPHTVDAYCWLMTWRNPERPNYF